jgi:glycosyltransferase involved in cell wall biosynthesis
MEKSNINITFATPYYMSGFGIENRVTELMRNLPSNFKKQIVCLKQTRIPPRGISTCSLPYVIHKATAFKPLHFTILSRFIRNSYFRLSLRNSDIIDAQYFPMTYLPKLSAKFIITWHSVTFPEFADNIVDANIMNYERIYMLKNMQRADMVLPVSKWAEREIKNFDNSIPTTVVPNGVDLNKFRFKPLEKRKKTIICVGRFVPHKGHMEVIKIFKDVISDLRDFEIKLIMVGYIFNKKFFESLKRYAKEIDIPKMDIVTSVRNDYNVSKESAIEIITKGKNLPIKEINSSISYLTNITDVQMPSIYNLGDLFVSCSHWEGFGMPMIEAQACGLPALGYDICSHKEVVANKNLLADENDTWTIAENIKKLFTNKELYEKECKDARRFAEQFSWDKVTKQYMDVIKKL